MPSGFGIVGCGMISNFHAQAIAEIPDSELVACFDMIPAAADKFAEAQGCKAYHVLEEMLADDGGAFKSCGLWEICDPRVTLSRDSTRPQGPSR